MDIIYVKYGHYLYPIYIGIGFSEDRNARFCFPEHYPSPNSR